MWPFASTTDRKLHFSRVDADYAVAGQISPEQLKDVATAGFKTVLCARPDGEEPAQPRFAEIAKEAERLGLSAVQIPVSGQLTEGAMIRMERALADLPRPIFAYCRSGARAGSLYMAALRARQ